MWSVVAQKFAQPRIKKQVRSFLGLCGYFRKFIPEFSTVAIPLLDHTKKNMSKTVKWTSQCEKAFGQLKQALTKAPVLITPYWDKPFILQTDASTTGLGHDLIQINADGEEHPIAFGSKMLLPREIKLFCHRERSSGNSKRHPAFQNIFGRNIFKIKMDHNPPTHLSTFKDSHGRLARWALSLQLFDYRIVHWSGKANANAYVLSGDQGSLFKEGGMSEIGTLTGEDPAERVEMALGQPITSREQSPERTLQEGKPQNHVIIAP